MARMTHVFRQFIFYLPRVKTGDRKVAIREKVIYTVISLLIYLAGSQLPLYGIHSTITPERPFHPLSSISWMRVIYAPNRGTVMEMGMIPMLSRWLLNRPFESTITNPRGLIFLQASKKLLGSVLSFNVAIIFVLLFGMYGSGDQDGMGIAILIIFQLWFGGIIVTFLDELLRKGYGFGSGISLFSAANICRTIIWKAFYQQNLHYVTNLLATVLIFLIVIYLQGFCVLMPLISRKDHKQRPSYPIKLFYTSYMPILLLSILVSYFHIFSKFLHINFSGNLLVDLLGKWKQFEYRGGQYSTPVGGIAYYITAPSSLADMAANTFHALFYLVFVLSTCALLSIRWTHFSYSDSIAVAVQLMGQMEPGSIRQLHRYIPIVAAFGGLCIGALTVLADITGAFGSASGILIVVTTISEYMEAFEKEKAG